MHDGTVFFFGGKWWTEEQTKKWRKQKQHEQQLETKVSTQHSKLVEIQNVTVAEYVGQMS